MWGGHPKQKPRPQLFVGPFRPTPSLRGLGLVLHGRAHIFADVAHQRLGDLQHRRRHLGGLEGAGEEWEEPEESDESETSSRGVLGLTLVQIWLEHSLGSLGSGFTYGVGFKA